MREKGGQGDDSDPCMVALRNLTTLKPKFDGDQSRIRGNAILPNMEQPQATGVRNTFVHEKQQTTFENSPFKSFEDAMQTAGFLPKA